MSDTHAAEDGEKIEEPKVPKRTRTMFYIVLAISLGLVTNILLTLLMDVGKVLRALSSVSLNVILLPVAAILVMYLIDSIRLKLVSRQCGYQIHIATSVLNTVLGSFFSSVTPLAAGGQPFQIYHLQKSGMASKTATNIILSRFVVNALVPFAVILFSLPLIPGVLASIQGIQAVFIVGLCITLVFALVFLAVLIQPQIMSWLAERIHKSPLGRLIARLSKRQDWATKVRSYAAELRADIRFLWSEGLITMIVDIFLYGFNLLAQGFALWYPLWCLLGPEVSYIQVLLTYIIVWQVAFYIPTPGASASLEGMYTLIFTTMYGHPEACLAAVIIWRFMTYYVMLIPGFFVSGFALPSSGAEKVSRFPRITARIRRKHS